MHVLMARVVQIALCFGMLRQAIRAFGLAQVCTTADPLPSHLLFRFAGVNASPRASLPDSAPPHGGLVLGVSLGRADHRLHEAPAAACPRRPKRSACPAPHHSTRTLFNSPPRLGLRRMSHFRHRVSGALGSLLGVASVPSKTSPNCARQ